MSERTKNTCSACGTAPINHALAWGMSFFDELQHFLDKLFGNFVHNKYVQKLASGLEKIMFRTARFFHIATFNKDDTEKTITTRSKIIWEEAKRRGIPMEQVMLFGKPTEYFRAFINGKFHYFNSLPIPPHLPQEGFRWIDDKLRLSRELNDVNLPAPKTLKIKTLTEARNAFERLSKPLIVKPEWGSRGRHTTTNIQTLEQMEHAFKLAKKIAISLVAQEHLAGSVYRATVINNKLVGFYRADQPKVTGDGVKTVEELIEEKNKNKPDRVSDVWINEDLLNFISRNGYGIKDVLPEGVVLPLSAKTGRLYGSYTKEMFPEVHPKMHGIFERAGAVCAAPVLGFDLIIENPLLDPDDQRWGIIECNSLPFIDLHYMALEGEPLDLSKNVWDLWKK